MSLAQRMVQWEKGFYKQGIEEGIEKGIEKGRAMALQQLLTIRFGELSVATRKRLDKASIEQLQHWTIRVLTAKKLSEVFRG